MTTEEKRATCLTDAVACLNTIARRDNMTLHAAKWLAALCVWKLGIIATQGKIPTEEECKRWLRSQGAKDVPERLP